MAKLKKRDYVKTKKITNPLFKLSCNLRSYVCNVFAYKGVRKKTKTFELIGCSVDELKSYLESQFESWMTWDNYGLYNGELNHGWDIDHIIPLSSAYSEIDLIKLNHYTNLRPLCSYTNRVIKKSIIQKG